MASERAQKSEVHETTDDAATSPASDARKPKGRPDDARQLPPRPATDRDTPEGDVDEDGGRLFPDSQGDKDESDFGGPVDLDDPKATS